MAIERRLFLLAAAAAITGCGRRVKLPAVAAGATVLALGDSITFGTGAPAGTSYPSVLAQATGWNIVNAGVPGDTSEGALARLPALMQEHSPMLVLLGIGGNDFLRKVPDARTRANVRAICQQVMAAGVPLVLIGVPQFSLFAAAAKSLSDHPLYEEIAEDLKLPLHAGGWSAVLSDDNLKSDAIHANAQGYAQFAQGLLKTLKDVGLVKS